MKSIFNKQNTFRRKILFFYILIIIIPIIISSILILFKISNVIYVKNFYIVNNKLLQLSNAINVYCNDIEKLSYDMAFNPEIQHIIENYDPNRFFLLDSEYKKFSNLFGITRFNQNKILYISLKNLDNQEVFSVGKLHKSSPLSTKEFLSYNINNYWSNVYKSSLYTNNDTINVISFYRKVIDPYYNTIGVLRIDINEDNINELYKNFALTPNADILLINNTKNILSSNNTSYLSTNINSIYNNYFDLRNTKGAYITTLNNTRYQVIYNSLSVDNWKLVALIPMTDIEKDMRNIKIYIILVFVFIICFGITLSIFFSTSITKPIYRLISTMKEVENGNLNATFKTDSNDEIALLGNSFNKMIIKIKSLINRIYRINYEKEVSRSLYLQSQVNPHFLYNTLDSIRWMARRNKDYEVSEQIESLSNLFRHVLNNGNSFTKFRNELEHINNYIKIQLNRFDKHISIDIDIDEKILDLYTINIILQPLVENSFVHGLENKIDGGKIKIIGRIKNNLILIKVIDNGVGANQEKIRSAINSSQDTLKAFSLSNLNKRIKLYFGNKYGLEFYSRIGKGTCVILKLPKLTTMPKWRDLIEAFNSR